MYLMIVSIHRDVSINVINKIIQDVPDQWTQRLTLWTATNNTFPPTGYRRSQPDSIAAIAQITVYDINEAVVGTVRLEFT